MSRKLQRGEIVAVTMKCKEKFWWEEKPLYKVNFDICRGTRFVPYGDE
jgi:hypothetical protein